MNRSIPLLFVLVLTLSSLVMVKPEHASAQITTPTPTTPPQITPSSTSILTPTPTPQTPASIPTPTPLYPKPLVPEFTVKLISSLPEANKTTIELTIKNQPFDNNNIYHYSFFYNVRIKTNDENWTDLYDPEDGYPTQSNSDYTVLSYVSGESAYYPSTDYPLSPSMRVGILPSNGQVDFQVEAMIGYRDRGIYSGGIMPYVFKGETSDWSNTQTITINAGTPSPTPTPTSKPTVTVSLSESASALNYGNTINFTASADGGVPPHTFTWYVDGQGSGSSVSPYFSTNSLPVGSHHVYVQVNDANGSSATTNSVAFEVLPASSPSSSIPESPPFTVLPFLYGIIAVLVLTGGCIVDCSCYSLPQKNRSIPEFPSFLVVSFLMATLLTGVIIYKKKQFKRT